MRKPCAPPVYRPQPLPRVLQRKVACVNSSTPIPSQRVPGAPPVYRPQQPRILQLNNKGVHRQATGLVIPPGSRMVVQRMEDLNEAFRFRGKEGSLSGKRAYDEEQALDVANIRNKRSEDRVARVLSQGYHVVSSPPAFEYKERRYHPDITINGENYDIFTVNPRTTQSPLTQEPPQTGLTYKQYKPLKRDWGKDLKYSKPDLDKEFGAIADECMSKVTMHKNPRVVVNLTRLLKACQAHLLPLDLKVLKLRITEQDRRHRQSLDKDELTLVDVKVVMQGMIYNLWNAATDQAVVVKLEDRVASSSTIGATQTIFSLNDSVAGIKTSTGTIWLDQGNDRAGLTHILARHRKDFEQKNILEVQITKLLENLIRNHKPVAVSGGQSQGWELDYYVAAIEAWKVKIIVASNGYIVTAIPQPVDWRDYHQQAKNLEQQGKGRPYSTYIGLSGYMA